MIAQQRELFNSYLEQFAIDTDRLFVWLFGFEWLLGILFAFNTSLKNGGDEIAQRHVYIAVLLGALIAAVPMLVILRRPGRPLNRFVVAVAQMSFSGVFIYLTEGRIETHFHIFGSMAFLAFYHDYRPIVLATLLTAIDHFVRGHFFPQTIYGVDSAIHWRALEHTAWIVFEDAVLFIAIYASRKVVWSMAQKKAQIESSLRGAEQSMLSSAKMSALGQMAGGVAHEINTPLAVIMMEVEELEYQLKTSTMTHETQRSLTTIRETADRIAKIIVALRLFARDGSTLPAQSTSVPQMLNETLVFCRERFRAHDVDLSIVEPDDFESMTLECRKIEISQVLLNLLNNAFDAVESKADDKWVRVEVRSLEAEYEFSVTDSGSGVPADLVEKIMEPFFSTKPVGQGTGLGLSLSKGILSSHGGKLFVDTECANTRFVFTLPKFEASTV